MTNRIALVLALLLVAGLAADQLLNGGQATLFLGRRFVALIHTVEFWR